MGFHFSPGRGANLDDCNPNINFFLDYEIEGVEVARVPDSVVFIRRGICLVCPANPAEKDATGRLLSQQGDF